MRDYYAGGHATAPSWVEQLDDCLADHGLRLVWAALTSDEARRITAWKRLACPADVAAQIIARRRVEFGGAVVAVGGERGAA